MVITVKNNELVKHTILSMYIFHNALSLCSDTSEYVALVSRRNQK